MGLFDHFPYTNVHELNLDWIMEQILTLKTTIEQFVSINALKYADPIQWNITSQYEKNTIVIDPLTGTAYISVQPVPSGVSLTNTDYWTVVFNLGSFVVKASKNFTSRYELETTLTATFSSSINDWLVWGDTLYRALTNITAGDQYVVGGNIASFTIEDVLGHIQDLDTTDKSNLVAAINELVQAIINEANRVDNITGDLDNLSTTDKSNLVAAINEAVQDVIDEANRIDAITGDLSNLNTQDKSNLVAAINETNKKSNFYSIRYGSFVVPPSERSGQAICKLGANYISCGGDTSGSVFFIHVLDPDLNILNTYTYNYNCHPNSMFMFNGYIYIIDSANSKIFIIETTGFTIINIISVGFPCYWGCVDDTGKAYVGNNSQIYRLYDDHQTELITTLNIIPHAANIINQGSFIWEDNIYKIQNMPNILIKYDMKGNYQSIIDVGDGNGYYPYGEIESFFYDNGYLYMVTTPYQLGDARKYMFTEIFQTNLISPITDEDQFGQEFPPRLSRSILKVDNNAAHVKNPDGKTNPFPTLFEASFIFNYLSKKYDARPIIQITGNSYHDDSLFIQNVECSVEMSNTCDIGYISCIGGIINISGGHPAKIYLRNAVANCRRSIIYGSDIQYSTLNLNRCVIGTGTHSIKYSTLTGSFGWNASGSTLDTIEIMDVEIWFSGVAFNATSGTIAVNEMVAYILKNYTATDIEIIYRGVGLAGSENGKICTNINTSEKNGINASTDAVSYHTLTLYDRTADKPFIADILCTIHHTSANIELQARKIKYFDNTDVTGSLQLYASMLKLRSYQVL